jgi:hypothetical protein
MRPPVPEDRPAREARCQHASKKKQTKETAKKQAICKAKEEEALKKLRCQQTIDGVPLASSPSEMILGEDDDSSDEDDDTLSRYETAIRLGDLPDIRPLLEPIRGSSSSVIVVKESEEEEKEKEKKTEKETGPSTGGAALPWTQQEGSTGMPAPAQAPQARAGAGTVVPASSSAAAPAGVRTRGQLASEAQKVQGGASVRAPRSARPAGGAIARPPSAAPGGSDRTGSRPLVPISG